MICQQTIIEPVCISGIGLHSGERINMTLRPADAGTGIIFHRLLNNRTVDIPARADKVVDTRLATVLGAGDVRISTVEHLLATLSAYGIDNLHIDIDGDEVPIMDGSAAPFASIIEESGIRKLPRSRKFISIREPVSVIDGEKRVSIIPSRFFRITFDIAFDHPCIALQQRSVKITSESFRRELASARTFGFLKDVETLKAAGLARGGSLENAIVIDDERILNPEGLRYQDEFVRHKILDSIGDLSLIGAPILGHVRAFKAGHDINLQIVEKLLANPQAWQILEFSEEDLEKALQIPTPTFASEIALSKA
ncbi:MAG: UDP-3-O-acyl-N-acetylglucosamine deacetylase [Deltaproteobacteria bacterium]|jgi:UDP-3-O-[3-hydroxymyristoyl] N-acetylglucosamine deacetylase|nr:UDP-3-O-acyl-N-acetylglucosamine deacetylase [Deltaproteobacteria bacterium]MBW2503333.1 UDP-3-O-acyl-N-acetylglucosamine deacetylase [Deltaproteobacteria bacterium]